MSNDLELSKGGANHQKPQGDDDVMTTAQGHPIADDQNWLSAGPRGPQLLEDQIAREKIFHFDHERIPERVVHARGYGVHGHFELKKAIPQYSKARIFNEENVKVPTFTRFSTVAGNKGSPDLARDVRGFRHQVLHAGRQLGPRRKQHPGVLYPGRDQVSGPDPCCEACARSWIPAGADCT